MPQFAIPEISISWPEDEKVDNEKAKVVQTSLLVLLGGYCAFQLVQLFVLFYALRAIKWAHKRVATRLINWWRGPAYAALAAAAAQNVMELPPPIDSTSLLPAEPKKKK